MYISCCNLVRENLETTWAESERGERVQCLVLLGKYVFSSMWVNVMHWRLKTSVETGMSHKSLGVLWRRQQMQDRKKKWICIFCFDFPKEFKKVPSQSLLNTASSYGIKEQIPRWTRNSKSVGVNVQFPWWREVTSGILCGSVLQLFDILIHSLEKRGSNDCMFADNIQLLKTVKIRAECTDLWKPICIVSDWSDIIQCR